MIIRDFDIVGIAISPHKANSPLIVDANAVLALAIASQRFQAVAWRRNQIAQLSRDVQLAQLSLCHSLKFSEPRYPLSRMESFRFPGPKRPDHDIIV